MSKQKQDDTWIFCPECNIKLKQEHLSNHLKNVHKIKIEDIDESSIKLLPKKNNNQKNLGGISKAIIGLIIIIIIVVAASTFAYITINPKESNINNYGNTDNDSDTNIESWMKNYTPTYKLGTGTNNFWINFPVNGPYAGQSIQHLTWITKDLEEKPVVFVCHRTGCAACTPQADRVKALMKTFGGDVVFYDLDNPFSGYGIATDDTIQKFNEAFYYDANGPPSYIAFTGVFTLIKDGGDIKIGWHSWEGDVADAQMETWIKDTIYYYNMNK